MAAKINMTSKQRLHKGGIDVKAKILLTNLKYLWLSLNTLWVVVFCIDTNVYTISEGNGINKEKEICLQNKEYISGQR